MGNVDFSGIFAPIHAIRVRSPWSATFQDSQISQTITNLDTLETYSSGVVSAPGFLLSSMNYLVLWGVTTTGESAWIDNVVITTDSAVPEPETWALLVAGLGLLGASARRRQ